MAGYERARPSPKRQVSPGWSIGCLLLSLAFKPKVLAVENLDGDKLSPRRRVRATRLAWLARFRLLKCMGLSRTDLHIATRPRRPGTKVFSEWSAIYVD